MSILEMFMKSQVKIDFRNGYRSYFVDRTPEGDGWILAVDFNLHSSDLLVMLADQLRCNEGVKVEDIKEREELDPDYRETRYEFGCHITDYDDFSGPIWFVVHDEGAEDDEEIYSIEFSEKDRELLTQLIRDQLKNIGTSWSSLFIEAKDAAVKNKCYVSKEYEGRF